MESLCFPPAGCAGAVGLCRLQAQTILFPMCCLMCQHFAPFSSRTGQTWLFLTMFLTLLRFALFPTCLLHKPKVLFVAGKAFPHMGMRPAKRGVFNATALKALL